MDNKDKKNCDQTLDKISNSLKVSIRFGRPQEGLRVMRYASLSNEALQGSRTVVLGSTRFSMFTDFWLKLTILIGPYQIVFSM